MLHWLVDPFTLGFMQRALVASLIDYPAEMLFFTTR